MGGRCGRQGRRKSEVVTTVVTITTVAVSAAWLGDFAVAAAAVNFGDIAGRRGAVVASRVDGGAVGSRGVVVVGCGRASFAAGSGASRGVEKRWLRQ